MHFSMRKNLKSYLLDTYLNVWFSNNVNLKMFISCYKKIKICFMSVNVPVRRIFMQLLSTMYSSESNYIAMRMYLKIATLEIVNIVFNEF